MEETKERRRIVLGWFRIAIGLLIFAYGVHLTIFANIGLAPWDCLGMGVAKHTPFNYGISMTLIAVTVLLIDLLMKERIGFGTVIDALKAQATQIRYKPGFVIYLHFSNEEQT